MMNKELTIRPMIAATNAAGTVAEVCLNMFFFIRDDVDDIGGVLGTLPCLHLFFCQFCLR